MGINLWFEQREIKVREGERGGAAFGWRSGDYEAE